MTAEQFRSNPALTARFRELLGDPVIQQAIIILRDGKPPVDAPLDGSERMSVRILSQMVGADAAINLFLSLADPLVPEGTNLQEEWKPPEDLPETLIP